MSFKCPVCKNEMKIKSRYACCDEHDIKISLDTADCIVGDDAPDYVRESLNAISYVVNIPHTFAFAPKQLFEEGFDANKVIFVGTEDAPVSNFKLEDLPEVLISYQGTMSYFYRRDLYLFLDNVIPMLSLKNKLTYNNYVNTWALQESIDKKEYTYEDQCLLSMIAAPSWIDVGMMMIGHAPRKYIYEMPDSEILYNAMICSKGDLKAEKRDVVEETIQKFVNYNSKFVIVDNFDTYNGSVPLHSNSAMALTFDCCPELQINNNGVLEDNNYNPFLFGTHECVVTPLFPSVTEEVTLTAQFMHDMWRRYGAPNYDYVQRMQSIINKKGLDNKSTYILFWAEVWKRTHEES